MEHPICESPATGICDCQSGVWEELSLSIQGKDVQSGPIASLMSYTGTDPDGINNYCRLYDVIFNGDGLVIANLTVNGISTTAGNSQLVALVEVNGRTVAQNYSLASSGGGFYTSAAGTESVKKGANSVRLCGGYRAVNNPSVSFSLSLIQ